MLAIVIPSFIVINVMQNRCPKKYVDLAHFYLRSNSSLSIESFVEHPEVAFTHKEECLLVSARKNTDLVNISCAVQ